MSSVTFEEILEEEAKALPPDERRQLRQMLSNDEPWETLILFLIAAGLMHFLQIRNAITHSERQRLNEMLNRAAADAGLLGNADRVRQVRGKYAHMKTGSEAFAAQKQEEVRLEDL